MTNDVEVQACRNCFVHAVNKPLSALRRLFDGVELGWPSIAVDGMGLPRAPCRSQYLKGCVNYGKRKMSAPAGERGSMKTTYVDYIDFRKNTKLATFQPLSSL